MKKIIEILTRTQVNMIGKYLLQKNYEHSPVECDTCHETPKEFYLMGGGVRMCKKCYKEKYGDE